MKNSGYTLIEMVLAMVIFCVLMLCSAPFFGFGHKQVYKAGETGYSLQLAKDKVEILKAGTYDGIPVSSHTVHYYKGLTYDAYYGASEVYTVDEQYKVVYVTVAWSAQEVNLHTIISP